MKILFSEGSSTSARQSLYALGPLGHVIDVCTACSPDHFSWRARRDEGRQAVVVWR